MDIWVILQYIFRYLSIPIWLYSYSLLMCYLCLTSLLGMDHTNVFRYKNDILQDYSFTIAAVLPKLRTGNPKCPSVNKEWLNKAWYIHTMLFGKPRGKKDVYGDREMTQSPTALPALGEDLGLIPGIHIRTFTDNKNSNSWGTLYQVLTSAGTQTYMVHINPCRHTHICII